MDSGVLFKLRFTDELVKYIDEAYERGMRKDFVVREISKAFAREGVDWKPRTIFQHYYNRKRG